MQPVSYKIYNAFYKPVLKLYLRFSPGAVFDGFKLKIFKGVFHPKLFFSTTFFYSFIEKLQLKNRSFLEIGCGSGLLSLLAAKKGASVTAIDISQLAVKNTQLNFEKNFSDHSALIFESDVFDRVSKQKFDVIVINPPYFFKAVVTESQHAWYCGSNGEYFESLFRNMFHYLHNQSEVFMILADNCDIDRIRSMAKKYQIEFTLAEEKLIKWEKNFIFQLKISLPLQTL